LLRRVRGEGTEGKGDANRQDSGKELSPAAAAIIVD
jgi:hypothetical protein